MTDYLPTNGVPTDIETNPTDPDMVYMTLNSQVFKSHDRGYTWKNITYNLPSASTNTIEYYKLEKGGLYVGTDAGIYYINDNMSQWISFVDFGPPPRFMPCRLPGLRLPTH